MTGSLLLEPWSISLSMGRPRDWKPPHGTEAVTILGPAMRASSEIIGISGIRYEPRCFRTGIDAAAMQLLSPTIKQLLVIGLHFDVFAIARHRWIPITIVGEIFRLVAQAFGIHIDTSVFLDLAWPFPNTIFIKADRIAPWHQGPAVPFARDGGRIAGVAQ